MHMVGHFGSNLKVKALGFQDARTRAVDHLSDGERRALTDERFTTIPSRRLVRWN